MKRPDRDARAIDLAAALVTVCLEKDIDQQLVHELVGMAYREELLADLTVVLAFGLAANIESIARLTDHSAQELWQRWCTEEATRR